MKLRRHERCPIHKSLFCNSSGMRCSLGHPDGRPVRSQCSGRQDLRPVLPDCRQLFPNGIAEGFGGGLLLAAE
jgi:hypothetical protein